MRLAVPHLYAIAIGSNRPHGRHGRPAGVVETAIARLDEEFGLFDAAPILINPAFGGAGRDFANSVALVESRLDELAIAPAFNTVGGDRILSQSRLVAEAPVTLVLDALRNGRDAASVCDTVQGGEPRRLPLVARDAHDQARVHLEVVGLDLPRQGEGELDRTEVGAEVAAAGVGDGVDDEAADLHRQLVELGVGELSQVGGRGDGVEERQGVHGTPGPVDPTTRRPRIWSCPSTEDHPGTGWEGSVAHR